MFRHHSGKLLFSPTDLVVFLDSPFASWMDRYSVEYPGALTPDARSDADELIAHAGDEFERSVLKEHRRKSVRMAEIDRGDNETALAATLAAVSSGAEIIYQARLEHDRFAGFSDFLERQPDGRYEVWDTKLARSIKPRYPVQLCAYTEMLAAMTGVKPAEHFGVILGDSTRTSLRVEDFIHYYRAIKARFLAMQDAFTGRPGDRPDPAAPGGNGRWESHAEAWLRERDHLRFVAGITTGQIGKLESAGIGTLAALAALTPAESTVVRGLASATRDKLVAQARLQATTRELRRKTPGAPPAYELLPQVDDHGRPNGLGALPPADPADVYFDMEGYPLVEGGLEYLLGACFHREDGGIGFADWWAHDRAEERKAFEAFVDWVHARWTASPAMHIYHYAAYEVSAVRRLSTRHNTRQDEVDDLLRHEVFVDLLQIVRRGVRVGEENYSLKSVEHLYRKPRGTGVATAADSVVQYNVWMQRGEARDWRASPILGGIRDYNEDDCRSTAELVGWLRTAAASVPAPPAAPPRPLPGEPSEPNAARDTIERRKLVEDDLRRRPDAVSQTLSDLVDFHRRESKPMWWKMFERASADAEVLRDDPACIAGVVADGAPVTDKRSQIQQYRFDPDQDCRLAVGDVVMFTHNLDARLTVHRLDADSGTVELRAGASVLGRFPGGSFPAHGSLIPYEYVRPGTIPDALLDIAVSHLDGNLPGATIGLLARTPLPHPASEGEVALDAAVRISSDQATGSFSVQGPPGTGKTYTAANLIATLLERGQSVGISSNSHRAVMNLFGECGAALSRIGRPLIGMKVGGDVDESLFTRHPGVRHFESPGDARGEYQGGIVGGTAWLFARKEWAGALDYLIVDEAGQVSLANAVAMSRAARQLILLGDQMQLEQPMQGAHPGDAGLSALQYALKDLAASREDAPEFHRVVPRELGIFLGESRRMHPEICQLISESIYEGRLTANHDCARQHISVARASNALVRKPHGVAFVGVEHDGNDQASSEEAARVARVFHELLGRPYTDSRGDTRPLALADFLCIAPYNAQVRQLKSVLPHGARVGSVDRFQGQEAAVCITSLCASYGEYGARGLAFILDRNRMNVALSRAKCLAVVVGDPRLAVAVPRSIKEMRLINLMARIVAT